MTPIVIALFQGCSHLRKIDLKGVQVHDHTCCNLILTNLADVVWEPFWPICSRDLESLPLSGFGTSKAAVFFSHSKLEYLLTGPRVLMEGRSLTQVSDEIFG